MPLRAILPFLLAAGTAAAGEVVRVPYTPLLDELSERIDFENYPRTLTPGTRFDDLLMFPGATIGERFAGQLLWQADGFDALSPTPAGPLSLASGAPGQNLSVSFLLAFTNQLSGLAAPGYPEVAATGEGAISILFEYDQAALGFRATAEMAPSDPSVPKGRMQVAFFRRDGSLIDAHDIALDWALAGYGFRRAGRVADIAGISITNRDPAGIAIDDVIYDTAVVTGRLDLAAD